MKKVKVLAFAGSLRKDSYNKMALKIAALGAREAGAEVKILDLKNLDIPLYDGDLEEKGIPRGVKILKQKLAWADRVLFATPEYNASLTGVFKNAIDWASRPPSDMKKVFSDKVWAILGATTGAGGTIKAQVAILPILKYLGVIVLPKTLIISNIQDVFDGQGKILDQKIEVRFKDLGKELVEFKYP